MLRKEQSIGFCRELRVEGKCSGARVQNMSRIYSFNCLLLLMFPRAQEVLLTCRHPRLDHAKQNLVIYGGSFNDQETSLVTGFDR